MIVHTNTHKTRRLYKCEYMEISEKIKLYTIILLIIMDIQDMIITNNIVIIIYIYFNYTANESLTLTFSI